MWNSAKISSMESGKNFFWQNVFDEFSTVGQAWRGRSKKKIDLTTKMGETGAKVAKTGTTIFLFLMILKC